MAIVSVRNAEAGGGLEDAAARGLDRDALVRILHSLVLTRRLDERGHVLYKQGKLPGSFYTCKGNEAASVGVAAAMAPEDVAAPLHRNLGVWPATLGPDPGVADLAPGVARRSKRP